MPGRAGVPPGGPRVPFLCTLSWRLRPLPVIQMRGWGEPTIPERPPPARHTPKTPHLVFITGVQGKRSYYSHFTGEEVEAQRVKGFVHGDTAGKR